MNPSKRLVIWGIGLSLVMMIFALFPQLVRKGVEWIVFVSIIFPARLMNIGGHRMVGPQQNSASTWDSRRSDR